MPSCWPIRPQPAPVSAAAAARADDARNKREGQPHQIAGQPRAQQPRAELTAFGRAADHRHLLREPLPPRGKRVPPDVGRVPAQHRAYLRQFGGPVGENRPGDHFEHTLAGQDQPLQHRKPGDRVNASRLAAKPATVATSTLCDGEESQVTRPGPR